ncbi:hypothetical protein PP352_19305, partial [Mycobacteroides abscessus]|nr:hypothetical protein [Mycobacteroides abscessus]
TVEPLAAMSTETRTARARRAGLARTPFTRRLPVNRRVKGAMARVVDGPSQRTGGNQAPLCRRN